MTIPKGKNHYQFYLDHRYDNEKITSRYEGVRMFARAGCCDDVIINWVASYNGVDVAVRPFTAKGEEEAYLALEAYKIKID